LEPNLWPADKVERWPIERLVPYARNARTHSDGQVEQVAASIREWGWTNPVLVGEDGGIIAGHCRVLAGKQLGLAEVPVMLAAGWSEAQKRAYVLADNQLALNAGWNPELLRLELGELQGLEFNIGLIGFGDAELAALLESNPGLTDPDEVPEPPTVPIAKRGEVWQLGRHRLACGDATSADDVAKVFGNVALAIVLTDPPYGINLDTRYSKAPKGSARSALKGREPKMRDFAPVSGDDKAFDASFLSKCLIRHAAEQFWFGADYYRRTLSEDDRDGSWLVWDKRNEETDAVIGSGFELVWSKQPHKRDILRFYWNGAFGNSEARGRMHPTQKPSALFAEILSRWSEIGATVIDPFVGSGTTIIAAEMTGRACHAIEINPAYVDVSIERWQNFTGEKAKRLEAA
jgi:DNA modification methylase